MIKFVPQQEAWIVERMGRFHRALEPGLQVLMPIIDQIKYVKSLKEVAIEIPSQRAITQGMKTKSFCHAVFCRSFFFFFVSPHTFSLGSVVLC